MRIKSNTILTIERLGAYLFAFLLVVVLVVWLVDWKWLDKYLVNEVNKNSSQEEFLNKDITLIHLERPAQGGELENFKLFRQRTVKLLNTIAEESKERRSPKGVVLDIWFSNDTTELENLKTALKQLKDLKIPVYAAYNINEKHERLDVNKIQFDEVDVKHALDLYNELFAGSEGKKAGSGRFHTLFYPEKYVANYENDIYLFSEMLHDTVLIESLARRVAKDLSSSKSLSHQRKRIGSIVPYGSEEEMARNTFDFFADSVKQTGKFKTIAGADTAVDIDNKILVVGDMINDLAEAGTKKIPGPYIVTWALSDLLDNNSRLKLPVENLYIIIGQLFFFSLFSVLIFALLFKYVKQLQTKPAIISLLSFLLSLAFLWIYGKMILSFNYVIPVGHTLVAMIVAVALSWRFAHKFLVTGVAEGAEKYDVFISYSRSQGAWVEKNVYEPLAAFHKPNGEKLHIFFDKKSIGIGEAFTAKYMWAIVDAKCFIPVISEDYYGKNHCRNELDCAIKRWVEKLITIQAIAFSYKAVPEAYNTINFLDINAVPDFIEKIKEKLSEQ